MKTLKTQKLVISTGGTIEKTYDEKSGTLSNRGSQLQSMLKRLRLPYTQIVHIDLLYKDSLDMTQEDRMRVLTEVKRHIKTHSTPVIILHGTDTMELTARLLYEQIPNPPIPIVMTGAMKPFGFEDSDALQNFIEALLVTEIVKPGIYISMHGKTHKMPGVVKNHELGTFTKTEY